MITFIIVIITLFQFGKGTTEEMKIDLALNSQNYFEDNIITYSKSKASDYIFGYSKNKACILSKGSDGYFAAVTEINSIVKSQPVGMTNIYKGILPINCFEYNEYSIIIFQDLLKNETIIFRGHKQKNFKHLNFDYFKFDHSLGNLYLIKDRFLYKVDLNSLEEIWTDIDSKETGLLKMNYIGIFERNFTDFLIFNNHIYFILDSNIYKSGIGENTPTFVSKSNSDKFNYLLFKKESKEEVYTTTSKILLYLFYFVDVILIFLLAYILKQLGIKPKLWKRKNAASGSIFERYETPPLMLSSISDRGSQSIYRMNNH